MFKVTIFVSVFDHTGNSLGTIDENVFRGAPCVDMYAVPRVGEGVILGGNSRTFHVTAVDHSPRSKNSEAYISVDVRYDLESPEKYNSWDKVTFEIIRDEIIAEYS